MDLRKLKYAGLCAIVAAASFGGAAFAGTPIDSNSTITVNVLANTPDVNTSTPMDFGQFMVINTNGAAVQLVLGGQAAPDTVDMTGAGVAGGSRFIANGVQAPKTLVWDMGAVTAAIPSTPMSFQIGEVGVGAGVFASAFVDVTDGVGGDAQFLLDSWNCGVTPIDGESFTTAPDPVTGIGALTTGTTGKAEVQCGATLHTVSDPVKQYADGAYTGNIRISVQY